MTPEPKPKPENEKIKRLASPERARPESVPRVANSGSGAQEQPHLTLADIADDPWNAVELPLPPNASHDLLKAARSAAESEMYRHLDLMDNTAGDAPEGVIGEGNEFGGDWAAYRTHGNFCHKANERFHAIEAALCQLDHPAQAAKASAVAPLTPREVEWTEAHFSTWDVASWVASATTCIAFLLFLTSLELKEIRWLSHEGKEAVEWWNGLALGTFTNLLAVAIACIVARRMWLELAYLGGILLVNLFGGGTVIMIATAIFLDGGGRPHSFWNIGGLMQVVIGLAIMAAGVALNVALVKGWMMESAGKKQHAAWWDAYGRAQSERKEAAKEAARQRELAECYAIIAEREAAQPPAAPVEWEKPKTPRDFLK